MAFEQKTWTDRVAEFINRRILTKEDGTTELVTVARSEGTVSVEGDGFTAKNMNDLEQRVADEFASLNGNLANLGGFTPVIDEATGEITGYKTTIGGADTVFPFSANNCLYKDGEQIIEWDNSDYPTNWTVDGHITFANDCMTGVVPAETAHMLTTVSNNKIDFSNHKYLSIERTFNATVSVTAYDISDLEEAFMTVCIYRNSSNQPQIMLIFSDGKVSKDNQIKSISVPCGTTPANINIYRMWLG